MRTMALELRRLQSDSAALKQSLIEIESRDCQSLNTLLVAMCMWMDCTDVATLILGNEGSGPGVEAQDLDPGCRKQMKTCKIYLRK